MISKINDAQLTIVILLQEVSVSVHACTTINHLQPLTRTKLCTCGVVGRHVACTLQISQSHMSHSTTSMRHTQSLVRVQTHDTVTSKLNQPCAHILHVYQCCVQLIRTHFCVYTAYTRNCAPVVLTLNSSISNKIYYIIIYHIYICRQPLQ